MGTMTSRTTTTSLSVGFVEFGSSALTIKPCAAQVITIKRLNCTRSMGNLDVKLQRKTGRRLNRKRFPKRLSMISLFDGELIRRAVADPLIWLDQSSGNTSLILRHVM